MNRLTVALSCLSFAVLACSSGGGTSSLTALTPVTSDAKCPNGGVAVTAGPDKNGNGKLDANEVNQTQEICNGADGRPGMDGGPGPDGTTSLVNTTALPVNDAHCPTGGTQLDFGLDNGAGGGTANDGVLQAGEILSTRYVCNNTLPYYPDDITPPASPVGQYVIRTSGGDGVNGAGGDSSGVSISLSPGSLGGGVKVFDTGKVDASFTLPQQPALVAGNNPLTVSTDLTINSYATLADGIASNDPFFRVAYDFHLYQLKAGAALEVTSLTVAAGKTLSLPFDPATTFTTLGVRDDIHNAGTIQGGTITDGKSGASLGVFASNFYQDATGTVSTRGLAAPGNAGGNGGPLTVFATALLVNQGTLDTSGGSGDSGGQGGTLNVSSALGAVYNTGTLSTFGGSGAVGGGGLGGKVLLDGFLGTFNSHRIDAYGGAGVTAGGNCQGVTLQTGGMGGLKNTGAVVVHGGACTGAGCLGGAGGSVSLTASGGDLLNDADLDSSGGKGLGQGGSAGAIDLETSSGHSPNALVPLASGSLRCDGNLIAVGGQGAPGGNGGPVTVRVNPGNEPVGQRLELLGYTLIEANGGKGDTGRGGNAGDAIVISTSASFPSFGESNSGAASGPVVNYARLSVRGGDGTFGGAGWTATLETQLSYDFKQPLETVINYGDIDVGSGSSSSSNESGSAGAIQIEGVSGMENHGSLKAVGGNAAAGSLSGVHAGSGGNIELACDSGPAKNTGSVDASGGGSLGNGGPGGLIDVYGLTTHNSGPLVANGGNATLAGGAGGVISVESAMPPSTNTGTFSVAAGTGTPPGITGIAYLDGIDVTP